MRALAPLRGIKSLLVVTSKYHTRRAGMIFRSVLRDMVRVHAIGSPYDDYQPSRWRHTRSNAHYLMIEYQKLLVFAVERFQRS